MLAQTTDPSTTHHPSQPAMNTPPTGKAPRGARFWDRIANRYARSPIADEATYQRKLAETREYLRPDMTVLEIGCGTGSTAIAHAPYAGHIHATDISAAMLDIARDKARTAEVNNVTFEQAAVDRIDAGDQSMDMVMAHSILHLVEDPEAIIRDMHRLLKPGGIFVTSTACLGDSYLRVFRWIAPLGRLFGALPLVKVLRESELLRMVQDAGFGIERHWRPSPTHAVFIIARKR